MARPKRRKAPPRRPASDRSAAVTAPTLPPDSTPQATSGSGGLAVAAPAKETAPLTNPPLAGWSLRAAVAGTPFDVFIILLAPVVVLLGNPLLFNQPGYIDPWIYHFFFRHLAALKHLFPATYYGSRLGWLLPGYLVYHVFPPLLASYVLHLGVAYTALFSEYFILRALIHRRAALLGALLLSAYPYFWDAVGWDYVDGAGIAYYLLALALLIYAASSRKAWALFAAGAACAGMVYTNVFTVIFCPTFPAAYLFFGGSRTLKQWFRALLRFTIRFGAAIVAVTAFCGVINYFLDGHLWFYGPSVAYMNMSVGAVSPWKEPNYSWLQHDYWLLFPALAAMPAALTFVLKAFRRPLRFERALYFLAVVYFYSVGLMIWLEMRGRSLFEFRYYVSYLIPMAALVLGAVAFRNLDQLRIASFRWTVAAALAFFSAWAHYHTKMFPPSLPQAWPVAAAGIILLIGFTLPWRGPAIAIVLLALSGVFLCMDGVLPQLPAASAAYSRITAAAETVEENRGYSDVRFWYDLHEPAGYEYMSISSCYLWGRTLINEKFPQFDTDLNSRPGTLLAILSNRADVSADAAKPFRNSGELVHHLRTQRFGDAHTGYWLHLFTVESDPNLLVPMEAHFDSPEAGHLELSTTGKAVPLPNDKWVMAADATGKGTMRPVPAGLWMKTVPNHWGYGSIYSRLVAPERGLYRFVLRYRMVRGEMNFGLLNADLNSWIAQSDGFTRRGDDWFREVTVDLATGQVFRLMTENFRESKADNPSEYVLEDLTVYRRRENPMVH